MEKVKLIRLETSDEGTFGVLLYGDYQFKTGELPWRNNSSNISCIPSGNYRVQWTTSPRFKRKMYEIANVPTRSGIRIHSANLCGDSTKGYKKQLNGCLALGLKLGLMDGQKAILLSSSAVRQFESLLQGQDFELEIGRNLLGNTTYQTDYST